MSEVPLYEQARQRARHGLVGVIMGFWWGDQESFCWDDQERYEDLGQLGQDEPASG